MALKSIIMTFLLSSASAIVFPQISTAQVDLFAKGYAPDQCSNCEQWNEPNRAEHLFGNTYYVGTGGLSSILIASPSGHVLIDGALPNSAPIILNNIRSLGFDPADVKLMLNSHPHFDHAGGFAALQKVTNAPVAASPESASVIRNGMSTRLDPQYGKLLSFPPVSEVLIISEDEPVQVGDINLNPIFTPGHTSGGTSWAWQSCEGKRCVRFIYADSLTPISRDDFLFSRNSDYPNIVDDFQKSFEILESIPCDILITPHPGASNFWQRMEAAPEGLIKTDACREYVSRAQRQLQTRLTNEEFQQ